MSTQVVMHDLIRQVIESLGAERGFVVLRKDDDWQVLATHYVDPAKIALDRYFSRTVVARVANEGEPLLCVDARESVNVGSVLLQGIRSILCAPLRWNGQVQGVVYADNSVRAGQFNETHLQIFSAITDQASRALEMSALQDQLRRVHRESLEKAAVQLDVASAENLAGVETVDFALSTLERGEPRIWNSADWAPKRGLSISLFGPFRVSLDGEPITDWSTRKNRELLAYLASHRGRPTHEEKLMDLFWPQGGKKGLHSLHNGITQLRKTLRQGGAIERKLDGYTLGEQGWVDLEEFDSRYRQGRKAAQRGSWDEALPLLGRADSLAGAEFLEGFYADWTLSERHRLEEDVSECRELLAKHFSRHGKHLIAVELWKRLLSHDRCRDDAYRGLMEAYQALGRRSEVMKTYQACERAYREELDLPPPDDLRAFLEI